jgi:flagellar basal-body rod modification protein FlgD
MASIDAIVGASNTTPPVTGSTTTNVSTQKLDGEMFLQLLVAQLRAQDPSSPMSTNDMMAQTTQLASMEQLTSLTSVNQENFSLQMRMAASGLIGKQVSYTDADGVAHTGAATAVSFADSIPMVTVGDQAIRLDAISGVASVSPTS